MDNHLKAVMDKRVKLTIDNLKRNNINGYHVKNKADLFELLDQMIQDRKQVTVGGAMTLFELDVIDYLRNRELTFLDRYADGLTSDDITEIYFKAFACDYYLASTNAITEKGEIYNVDGRGNRVAAMIYGPKKVVLIVGTNKIVKDMNEAIDRNRRVAAPANVQRLNRETPCATTGYCTDCKSPQKICHAHTTITSQMDPDRMHIIFVDGNYGY